MPGGVGGQRRKPLPTRLAKSDSVLTRYPGGVTVLSIQEIKQIFLIVFNLKIFQ